MTFTPVYFAAESKTSFLGTNHSITGFARDKTE